MTNNDLAREIEMQTRAYDLAIDQAIERLRAAKGGKPSTHLGHNLAAHAAELSALAAKIEQTENVVRWVAEAAPAAGLTFAGWTLDQLQERARLNGLRGIAVSQELRDEIARRENA